MGVGVLLGLSETANAVEIKIDPERRCDIAGGGAYLLVCVDGSHIYPSCPRKGFCPRPAGLTIATSSTFHPAASPDCSVELPPAFALITSSHNLDRSQKFWFNLP